MTQPDFGKSYRRIFACVLLVALIGSSITVSLQARKKWRYRLDPPVTLDFDMEDIPEPTERKRSFYYDFLYSTFGLQAKETLDIPRVFRKLARKPKEAYNVNILGEVPDSSWFSNRNTSSPMSLAEVRRGPNQSDGPAPGPWTVIRGKTEGITPGFLIEDALGEIYQLKFDPTSFPEMTTAAEVIASKLYYAAGYNVKENYIVRFTADHLVIASDAEMADRLGRDRSMTREDVEKILQQVPRLEDGRYRAVAGKYLPGKAKGPFALEGVRKDDPNDWIPHEHRRDLRGLRIFASWVNENDMREGNTLDMYVEEDGRRFLRHYLIDFGSSLGSETIHPNRDRTGNEYQFDAAQVAKSAFSLGLYRKPWKGYSRDWVHSAAGFLEADVFDPGRWRANYPILPFENMTKRDALWGTKLVLSFSNDQIRAAVETGEFSDPAAVKFLAAVLIARRDKIGRHWLRRVNPLDRFEVAGDFDGELQFRFVDLEVKHGYVEPAQRRYEIEIRQESQPNRTLLKQSISGPSINVKRLADNAAWTGRGDVVRISIRTITQQGKSQGKPIHVYLGRRTRETGIAVLGIERTD